MKSPFRLTVLFVILAMFGAMGLLTAVDITSASPAPTQSMHRLHRTSLLADSCFVLNFQIFSGFTEYASADASALWTAIDEADSGDTLYVSGECAGVQASATTSQTAYFSKTLTLVGGYNPADWSYDYTNLTVEPLDPQTYTTTLNAGNSGRVVYVASGTAVTLTNLILTNGGTDGDGGGLYNDGGVVTLNNSHIVNNTSTGRGAGLFNNGGSLTIAQTAFTQNQTTDRGGAIFNASGTILLENSTLSGNTGSADGGALFNENGGDVTIQHSTIVSNSNTGLFNVDGPPGTGAMTSTIRLQGSIVGYHSGADCANLDSNVFVDNGYNLVEDGSCISNGSSQSGDPLLSPLAENDGYTPTHEPTASSPALNVIPDTDCQILTDQRGFPRLQGGLCEIGSYELAYDQYFVDEDAVGLANGLSWTDAYTTVQDALAVATSGAEIWVAEGVYYPDEGRLQTDNNQTATHYLADGVALYGGFTATETMRTQRDWEQNQTILSGDIDGNDSTDSNGVITHTDNISGLNAYHLVWIEDVGETAVLDGFTITGGTATEVDDESGGGGVKVYNSQPQISNLIVIGNAAGSGGGGMAVSTVSTEPYTLQNITFINNLTDLSFGSVLAPHIPTDPEARGGGLFATQSLSLIDVHFIGNTASEDGGGLFAQGNTLLMENVSFIGNSSTLNGGGFYFSGYEETMQITNTLITGNSARNGAGAYLSASLGYPMKMSHSTIAGNLASQQGGGLYIRGDATVENSMIWGNEDINGTMTTTASIYLYKFSNTFFSFTSTATISHSLISASNGSGAGWNNDLGTDGGGNLDEDPLFRSEILASSAPSTAGDYTVQGSSPTIDTANLASCASTDILGVSRPQDAGCDMGAYEWQPIIYYVDADQMYSGTAGDSWMTAFPTLQDALAVATDGSEIWVAEGIYYPDLGTDQLNNSVTATFELATGVAIYGGFAATETMRTQRDWENNITVLSGDIDGNDSTDSNGIVTDTVNINGANSYYLVSGSWDVEETAVLDGFTLTANTQTQFIGGYGGAIILRGQATLANLHIIGNVSLGAGGGMAVVGSGSDPVTLTNVSFSNNVADETYGVGPTAPPPLVPNNPSSAGGGLYAEKALVLQDVTFSNNYAASDGGGLYTYDPVEMNNVIFEGNEAQLNGGGLYFDGFSDSIIMTNTVWTGNAAMSGAAVYMVTASGDIMMNHSTVAGNKASNLGGGFYLLGELHLNNSIVWGNEDSNGTMTTTASIYTTSSGPFTGTAVITNSLISASNGSGAGWNSDLGTDGGGNIDEEPKFVLDVSSADAPTTEGYTALAYNSPALDRIWGCSGTDIRGVARPQNLACDMGAYERLTLVLTGTVATSSTVSLDWNDTVYGSYAVWSSSDPYSGYTPLIMGLTTSTYAVGNSTTFYYAYDETVEEVSNPIGVFTFSITPGD